MIQFVVIASILSMVAAAIVAWPLVRKHPVKQARRRQINKLIYKQRLAEIENEQANGRLSVGQAQAQRDEAGRALLSDLEQGETRRFEPGIKNRWPLILIITLLIPLLASGLYVQGDSWRLLGASSDTPPWEYLTRRMEQHLAEKPDDQATLLMLARTRRAQGDTRGALEDYARLNALSDYSVAEYLADEAETRILMAQGAFSEISRERLGQALVANPDDGRALWYAGLAALQAGDQAMAVQHWQRLSQQQLPEAFRAVLVKQLAQLGASPASASIPGPVIKLRISANEDLVEGLPPDTPVFVMARPADGSRAMLAVRKHRLDELPLETQLTDGMNMAGGPQLSAYDEWRIVVRIAVSGDALPRAGDPFAELVLQSSAAEKTVSLSLDQRWP